MLILFDAGNTRLKWGAWKDGAWVAKGALTNDRLDELPLRLLGYAPTWIGVSCVAGEASRERVAAYASERGVETHWLRSGAELFGMTSHYRAPETLGSDRFATLFACHCMGLAPCVAATAGTALTVDALSSRGEFLGGTILPGAGLMHRALATGTAGLVNSAGVCQDFPQATAAAIETGIRDALVGSIDAMRTRLERFEDRSVAVVLSGGDAAMLSRHLSGEVRVVEDMVLEGLLWLAKHLGARGV